MNENNRKQANLYAQLSNTIRYMMSSKIDYVTLNNSVLQSVFFDEEKSTQDSLYGLFV
jgi:hypothetical protein